MKCAGGLTSKLIALIGGARHQLTNTQQIVRLHTGAIVKRVLLCRLLLLVGARMLLTQQTHKRLVAPTEEYFTQRAVFGRGQRAYAHKQLIRRIAIDNVR